MKCACYKTKKALRQGAEANMNLNYFHSYKLPAVIAFFLAMLIGAEFYRIRELLAALVMFTRPIRHLRNGFPDDVSG
jgi:uncharacterized integral membrane protein